MAVGFTANGEPESAVPPELTEIGIVVFTKFCEPATLQTCSVAAAAFVNVTSVTPVPIVTLPWPLEGFERFVVPALLTATIDVTVLPAGTVSATATLAPTGNVPST